MADFVAVIRRAVDGLANNTPEMRAKVYDKARGAVQRQLENMKPRPPEDMLRRQMEKLEAAILSVESEHAEALPAEEDLAVVDPSRDPFDDDVPSAAPVAAEAPAPEAATPVSAEEPVEPVRDEAPVYHADEPASAEADPAGSVSVVAEPEPQHYPEEEVAAAEPAAPHAYEEPQHYEAAEPASEPATEEPAQQYGDWRDDLPPEEAAPAAASAPEDYHDVQPVSPAVEPSYDEAPEHVAAYEERAAEPEEVPYAESERAPEAAAEALSQPEPVQSEPVADPWLEPEQVETGAAEPDHGFHHPAEPEHEPAPAGQAAAPWDNDASELPVVAPAASAPAVDEWGWEAQAPAAAPAHDAKYATDVAAAWDEVPELVPAGPTEPVHQGAHGATAEAHFDPEMNVQAESVRMPPVSDFPELSAAAPAAAAAGVAGATGATAATPANDDPFAEFFDPQPKAAEGEPAKGDTKPKTEASDPWGDLEELIGFSGDQPDQANASRGTLHGDVDADELLAAPAKPYRVTPVRKRNYAGMLLGLVGLLLVAGGGYAIWMNRDSLNDLVEGLVPSGQVATQTAEQTPSAPETPAADPAPEAAQTTPPADETAAAPATQPPATPADSNASAATPSTAGAADGSVAGEKFTQRLMADGSEMDAGPGGTGGLAQNAEGQSVAQLNAPPAQPAQTPPSATDAAPADETPAATPSDAPALAGEKMFLYEERIGQTAPTAIEGAVSWSLQREPGENGRQEPVVQGRLNIPGRGLTALLTFKRNTDPSLPASHLVEIVFAVPADFEGGAIESVQRIAMKSTEQDRGNALIAVPAKITDDFHMIALNDFPDARNTNLELLRSRNWIDIPLAYRNGRRALLTLQKGADGERIFADAIKEWSAMAPASGQ